MYCAQRGQTHVTYRQRTRRVTTVRRGPRRANRRKLEARRVLRLPTARPTRTRLRPGGAAERVAGLLNGEQAEARGVTPPQLLGLWRVQALARRPDPYLRPAGRGISRGGATEAAPPGLTRRVALQLERGATDRTRTGGQVTLVRVVGRTGTAAW